MKKSAGVTCRRPAVYIYITVKCASFCRCQPCKRPSFSLSKTVFCIAVDGL